MQNAPHVLVLALGPVQDFIAAARRCRDLWFGSWLLSELAKAAALAIAEHGGPGPELERLVFPGTRDAGALRPASNKTVANKIVAALAAGLDPAAVAAAAGEAVRTRLEALGGEAFGEIDDDLPSGPHFNREVAGLQLADLIEVVWAAAPQGPGGYRAAYREAERLLAGRKATRLWQPVPWTARLPPGVPKSSLDGQRESVLMEALFDGIPKLWTAEQVRQGYGVDKAERLCGVGLLKRHGKRKNARYGHRFLSTGHLAAWPLLERLEGLGERGAAAGAAYLDALEALGAKLAEWEVPRDQGGHPVLGPYDGSLLFESRLPDLFADLEDPAERSRRTAAARRALAGFFQAVDLPAPLPYYAILVADGDRMGAAIERQEKAADHRDISLALDRFAQSAQEVVEKDHKGELIYAGGDDVLAFVPLHRAVACARALAERFSRELARFPAGSSGAPPTLSAGIGVAHFLDPLRGALDLARRAEASAKRERLPDRGSFALLIDKRSGPPVAASGPWGEVDRDLDGFTELHRRDWLPDGAAYELRDLARLAAGAEASDRQALADLTRQEAERVLRRKQPGRGTEQKVSERVIRRLLARLDGGLPLAGLADRLIAARLLAQAADQAGAPLPEAKAAEEAA
jgi:CRISPR-associated protein Cmr2